MNITLLFILTNLFLIKKHSIKDFYLVAVFYTFFFHIGYAISFGNIYITMTDITLLYLFIRVFVVEICIKKQKIDIKNINIVLLLITIALLGIINVSLFYSDYKLMPITGDYDLQVKYGNQLSYIEFSYMNIIRIFLFSLFLLTSLFLNFEMTDKFKNELRKGIFKIGIVYVLLMYIELILKYYGYYISVSRVIIYFCGDYGLHTFGTNLVRYGKVWLQGFTYEPGYTGMAIFLYLLAIEKGKKSYLYQILGIVIMVLNSSLTSFILLGCYLYTLFVNSQKKIQMIIISIVLIVILHLSFDLSPYFSRILNVFVDNQGFTSESIRKKTMLDAIKNVLNNPFVGYGIGSTRSLSFLTSITLNIGISGTILWWLFIYKTYKIKKISSLILILLIFSILGTIENMYNLYIPTLMILLDGEKNEKNNIY